MRGRGFGSYVMGSSIFGILSVLVQCGYDNAGTGSEKLESLYNKLAKLDDIRSQPVNQKYPGFITVEY